MPLFRINDANIFSSSNEIYISFDDENLIKITGSDSDVIERILEFFDSNNDYDAVYKLFSSEFGEDIDYFNLIINYLVENYILVPDQAFTHKNYKIDIIGQFADTKEAKKNLNKYFNLREKLINLTVNRIVKSQEIDTYFHQNYHAPDLVVIFSPLLYNIEPLKNFVDICRKKYIPIFHLEVEDARIILGPIFDQRLGTPSLLDYLRRKYASLQNPDKFISFSRIGNKKLIKLKDPLNCSSLDLALCLLIKECSRYFSNNYFSNVLAREVEIDLISYRTTFTKIYKTVFSVDEPLTAPFNG